jgi:hypothetical protein
MTYNEYMWYRSEIYTLERLLSRLAEDRVVLRIGYEERLQRARQKLEGVVPPPRPKKMEVSFTGKPVQSYYGIDANFAAESIGITSDAVRLATAGATGELKPTGDIPRKTLGQLIITGVTLGSFGFKMELPFPEGDPHGFSYPEQAVQRIQTLLSSADEASDDQLSSAAMAIHPRAVNKTADLLDLMRKRDAQLAMEYQSNKVALASSEDIERVAKRLNPANVEDQTTQVTGTMIGVIPATRQFELGPLNGPSIQGRVDPDIRDPYQIARDFTNQQVSATIRTIRVGRGAPKHTLVEVSHLRTA